MGVGSIDDPEDYIGLSHLIEHLLFTGSKNFKNNSIDDLINKYSGSNNGITQ